MRNILVWNKKEDYLVAPLVYINVVWILGILGGNIWLRGEYISLFLMSILIGSILWIARTSYKHFIVLVLFFCLSFMFYIYRDYKITSSSFEEKGNYVVEGTICKVDKTPYTTYCILKEVHIDGKALDGGYIELKIPKKIEVPLKTNLTLNDKIKVTANVEAILPAMNPSDHDYTNYLKAHHRIGQFKCHTFIKVSPKMLGTEYIKDKINTVVDNMYSSHARGILKASLLGEDEFLEDISEKRYMEAGIGHLLCISGFHMAIISAVILFLLGQLYLPYTLRYILMVTLIWGYCLLTGSGTSTVRAAIMITVVAVGKCIWEEDDPLSSLSLASLILLIYSPWELFEVGFSLSFLSVLAIILYNELIERRRRVVAFNKVQKSILIIFGVNSFIWPIMAYHFYQVPFLSSSINLIVMPLFSIAIILAILSVVAEMLEITFIAKCIAMSVEVILYAINDLVELALKLPFATLVTGRPSFIDYLLYGLFIVGIVRYIFKFCSFKSTCLLFLVVLGTQYVVALIEPTDLRVTALYIGQGDATIIEMPNKKLVVIDAGNVGKGQVVERFIKYKGYDRIDLLMITHSDSDHISGGIELVESALEVGGVWISSKDDTKKQRELIEKCSQRKIPIYTIGRGDTIAFEEVKLNCLAPYKERVYMDCNDASIVCQLQYKGFSALFTGDKSITSDQSFYKCMTPITLLKVSHHGSRTGTSRDLLLKLQPKYAMISCGINNRFGHPHKEVVDLLGDEKVSISRTDLRGAISFETDGVQLRRIEYRGEG